MSDSEGLINTWCVDFIPLDRWEFRQRSNQLEESLLSRLSISVLAQRGILDDSELAASLHSVASKLNHKLAHRSSMADLQNKNILPLNDDDADSNTHKHIDNTYHTRKESLQEALEQRPDFADIADLGYIDDSGMAPALQPTALRLNRRLTERKTRDDLVLAGIIPMDNTTTPRNGNDSNRNKSTEREKKKKKKKKKGKRNSRSEKHEKTPSILWTEVKKANKKKKSKKIGAGHDDDENVSSTGHRVGDRVRLTKGRSGTIRYIGKPHFAKDERIGIDLDKWSAKGHDGRVGKFRYFSTKYGHGTFVTKMAVIEKLKSAAANSSNASAQFNIGDYVEIKGDRKGFIRYIGSTGIVRGCLVGIELDEKSPAGHDGRFGGKNYFECPEGHGIFVRIIDVLKILKTAKQLEKEANGGNIETIPDDVEISEETISDALNIGDRVTLANKKQGIIKYIGKTEFSAGKPMLGIELDDEDPTAQDGSVGSKTYFNTPMGKGIFVRRASVVAVGNKELAAFIKEVQENKSKDNRQSDDDQDDDESDKVSDLEQEDDNRVMEVGDYVELGSGITGIIKFIGATDFAKDECIGLEMNTWDSEGGDGTRNGKRYFRSKPGHATWTRRNKIARYLKVPAHLKNVDIQQLLKERTVDGKRIDLVERFAQIEAKQSKKDLMMSMGAIGIPTQTQFDNAKVGDRVELDRGKMGTIRYIGQVKFNSSEEVLGIELDRFDAQAHDGRGYFETKKGHGHAIFKTKDAIKRLIPMDNVSTPVISEGGSEGFGFIAANNIQIDDRVRLQNGRTGVIRWKGLFDSKDIGYTEAEDGESKEAEQETKSSEPREHFGIELDISDSSGNNGYYKETKYFNCAPNRGIFVPFEEIMENLGSTQTEWLHHKYTILQDQHVILKINMRIQTVIGGCGIIRYLGNPGFVDDLMYGLELDQWSPNATNGFVNGEEFFLCEQGKGFFVGRESIIKCLTADDMEVIEPAAMDLPQLKKMPRMHDKIKLVDGQIGVICFIGMLEFSSETYIGIKLDQWSPNGNDGSAAGKKYFKCEPGHGYFVKLIDCAANLGSIISTAFKNKARDEQKKTGNLLKVGDKIKLQDGGVGIVKYIGSTHFNEEDMVGIELDSWSANGHNGKVKGRTYFKATPGCGTFARRGSIMQRIPMNLGIDSAALVPLPDAGDKVKLKNGDIGVVQWIEDTASKPDEQKQIQIQLLEQDGGSVLSSVSAITLMDVEENLGRQTTVDDQGVTEADICVGVHVRLTRGKTGHIRYIGAVGNVDELIGIELDSWSHNGHDGKGHFKCQIGRGYFTKRTNIIGIIALTEKSTQEQLQLKRHRNIRKLRKKLRKILMLEQKAKNGLKLSDEQQQQLVNKGEYQRQLQELQQAFARNTPAIQIDDIVKHDIVSIQKIPEVAMYDTIILDTGERGRVVFIGDVHFDDHEMLGIVLDKWSPNAHNGSIDGKSYFVAPDGRGLLVPISAVHDVVDGTNVNRADSVDDDEKHVASLGGEGNDTLSKLKVGDSVQLGAKKGTVKYVGTTDFSKDEPVLGIELDDWSANANDGSIAGKKYFDASPGKGYFMRKQSYMTLADMLNASEFTDNPDNEIYRRDSVVIHDVSHILPIEYDLGDKVRLESGDCGVIKFIGKTSFCVDKLIGVELDKWSPNGHNGSYKDTPYFDAVDGRGFFVRHDLIVSKVDPNNPMPLSTLYNKSIIRPPNTRIGDRIRLKNGLVGVVRFQGKVDFSQDVYLGLELEGKHYNGNDGQAHARRYFSVRKKRGYFARKTEIARILTSSGAKSLKQMKKVKSLTDFPKLGDKVKTAKGKTGIVQYVGSTNFAKGILIGLVLDQWWPNGHDGSVKKQRYFRCATGRGYFTRLSHLIENYGPDTNDNEDVIRDYNEEQTHSNLNRNRSIPDHGEGEGSDMPKFKVGDRVKLQHGKTGVVRFIGRPDFAEDEVVGIELDTWSANAGDGSVRGEHVFQTSAGRGYFTRRKSVANIIQSRITEGAYARLKGLLRVPKFNGKTVKIVAYVEKKGRWKVKLLHAKQEKKYLGVREENLDPILDWEPINDTEISKLESLKVLPSWGDRVRTRKGRYGVVKYIGTTDFSAGRELIGLELEQWDPNGHNGSVKERKYYETMDGRGYFVKLDNLVENLGKEKTARELEMEEKLEEDKVPRAPLPAPPTVKKGDRVKLAKGRTGVVKYIGTTEFSDGKEVIGLELDTYHGGGSEKHQKYFDAPKGRGYFTRRASISNIVLPANFATGYGGDAVDSEQDKTTKRLISRTRKKLREIEVLEFKHKSGVVLHPNQIAKMNRKDELTAKLEALKNDTWHSKRREKVSGMSIRERVGIMARRTSIDWTGKYADKEIVEVDVDDAVRVANGGTGVVRYVGPIDFLGDDKNVIGVLMDQWHPSYGNGTIDGKKYFNSDDGRGYFAHPPEIVENLGSTKPKGKAEAQDEVKEEPQVGQQVTLKDGSKGIVKYVGTTEFSEEKMVGVELENWSTNTNSGTVEDTEYFSSNPGRGYFARFQSISDWKNIIPKELIDEAKQLDNEEDVDDPIDSAENVDGVEISVNLGDRIVSTRGYTGVVRFKGTVHFDEREVIGIELDQWSPNGHNGIIHGHKYFSCTDGRGYFIRKNGVEQNVGPTRRRRKSRTQSMMDFSLIRKNLKVGDHIKLARGKTGVVKYIGKASDMGGQADNNEDVIGIELDKWSANGNDGKSLFKTSKGRGYFARRSSIANIMLPTNLGFDDLQQDEHETEIANIKRQLAKIEKKLREIEVLEQKQKAGEILDSQQMAKIDRKKHLREKLMTLKQELASLANKRQLSNSKTRGSLENDESIRKFNTRNKRRGSINKEDGLRNIEIGDRVRLVRGKTGIVKYLGNVDFTDEEVVGIILDKWHPNANNGMVKGKQYFKAPPGRGYFAKRALIIENLGKVSIHGDLIADDNMISGAPLPKINFKIGDRVKLARGKTGIVKFIGETEFAKGEVIGMQLDTWTPAGHNGTVRSKKYFEAQDGRGYFTRRSSISNVVIPLVKPLKQRRLSITYKLNPLGIGDRVRIVSTADGHGNIKSGIIRYIGYPSFADGEVIGIELDEWSVNAHGGSANGIQIFDTSPGRGIFARRDEVEKYDPEKEKLEQVKKNLKLGDTVLLTSNRKGHVKYIGPVTGQDEMIGVELESWSPEAKDGRYDGFRYFTAPDGRGVFVKRSAIVDVVPLENDPDIQQALRSMPGFRGDDRKRSYGMESEEDDEDMHREYQVGDRVVIDGGNKGYIRYIGKDIKNEGVYGIELDLAVPKGTDGRHNNKRFFVCRNNHAIFVRKRTIMQIIDEDEIVIPQIGNRVKLTQGRFGIIQNIDEMDDGLLEYNINIDQLIDRTLAGNKTDIAHKRQHSNYNAHGRRQSITGNQIKSTRQSGLLDIQDMNGKKLMVGAVDDDSDNYDSDDDNYTALGETIELRSGKIGTIRFIGPVHFAKDNWIGVELHDHFGPHDGAVRGVRYFTCPAKRGIFVKQIKGRKKDDPTRQHLKRRCPECYGEFIKKRDPRAAYKAVGIVCDGCCKHGNEFSSNDWYFQCGQCEQTDFCLKCMLKLPAVSSDDMLDSWQNIRAKFKPIGAEWIFEDIHNDEEEDGEEEDDDREEKKHNNGNSSGQNSKFLHAPIKSIFDHFDKNNDGKLTDSDINDLYKASKQVVNMRLFMHKTPMRYQQFEQCWKEIAPSAAQNILEYMSIHVKNQPNKERESIEMLEKVRDIFEYFDRDMDGILTLSDIENMIPLIDINWNSSSKTKLLFDPPCDFIKFLAKIQSSPEVTANNVLNKLLSSIHLKIEDVFNIFCENKSKRMSEKEIKIMYGYAYRQESDWRSTFAFPCSLPSFIENWSSMGIYEQHGILDESKKRIDKRLINVFNYFDETDKGTLNTPQIQEILQLIEINNTNSDNYKLFLDKNNGSLTFDMFRTAINLLHRSITVDILPAIEQYIRQQNPNEFEEIKENNESTQRKKFGVTSKRRESSIIEKHLDNRPKLSEVIAKNILDVTPEIDPETAQAMKKLKRVRDMIILNRRIPLRPSIEVLYAKNIAPYGAFDSKGHKAALQKKKRQRQESVMHLTQLFKARPDQQQIMKIMRPSTPDMDKDPEQIINPLNPLHRDYIASFKPVQGQKEKTIINKEEEEVKVNENNPQPFNTALMYSLSHRPPEKELWQRNILINSSEKKEHRRRASQKLMYSLSQRPTFAEVVERGILMNENEQFNEKIRELLSCIDAANISDTDLINQSYKIISNIKTDYSSMISRLNGQIFEYKQTLNQFQDDVHSREQRLRTELENKQRVLIHMNGIIEQQKNDQESLKNEYETKMTDIEEEYKEKLDKNSVIKQNMHNGQKQQQIQSQLKQHLEYVRSLSNALQQELLAYHHHNNQSQQSAYKLQQLQQQKKQINNTIDNLYDISLSLASASASASANAPTTSASEHIENNNKQYQEKLNKQKQQISKLKQQKKEMVKLVNDKMRDLKFIHQQELQKERQIANVIVENHKTQSEAFKDRENVPPENGNMNNYQMIQMQQQMEQLRKAYAHAMKENSSLKKSKNKLERIVVKLSDDIVKTAKKK